MRRLIDVAVALMGLAVFSPLLLGTALAILIVSQSNPFYAARRIGIAGHEFRMWKFRTMMAGADRGSSITGKRDRRVTPLGRLLRKTKLDELPQLFNLLTGDMTLVGPRPEAPDMFARYSPEQRQVLAVKPGLTGASQIGAADESDTIPHGADPAQYYVEHLLDRKVAADLEYIATRTVWSDARVLFATIGIIGQGLIGIRSSRKESELMLPSSAIHSGISREPGTL